MGSNPMTGNLIRRGKFGHMERRMPHEDTDTEGRLRKGSHMKTEAEIEVMHLQAKIRNRITHIFTLSIRYPVSI